MASTKARSHGRCDML